MISRPSSERIQARSWPEQQTQTLGSRPVDHLSLFPVAEDSGMGKPLLLGGCQLGPEGQVCVEFHRMILSFLSLSIRCL